MYLLKRIGSVIKSYKQFISSSNKILYVSAVYSEQSNRGSKHAATEPTASICSVTGSDCHENS